LKGLESERASTIPPKEAIFPHSMPLFTVPDRSKEYQEKYEKMQRILSQVEVDTMTPLQALQFLAKLKEMLKI
jgi:hypothetical protein